MNHVDNLEVHSVTVSWESEFEPHPSPLPVALFLVLSRKKIQEHSQNYQSFFSRQYWLPDFTPANWEAENVILLFLFFSLNNFHVFITAFPLYRGQLVVLLCKHCQHRRCYHKHRMKIIFPLITVLTNI